MRILEFGSVSNRLKGILEGITDVRITNSEVVICSNVDDT